MPPRARCKPWCGEARGGTAGPRPCRSPVCLSSLPSSIHRPTLYPPTCSIRPSAPSPSRRLPCDVSPTSRPPPSLRCIHQSIPGASPSRDENHGRHPFPIVHRVFVFCLQRKTLCSIDIRTAVRRGQRHRARSRPTSRIPQRCRPRLMQMPRCTAHGARHPSPSACSPIPPMRARNARFLRSSPPA